MNTKIQYRLSLDSFPCSYHFSSRGRCCISAVATQKVSDLDFAASLLYICQ